MVDGAALEKRCAKAPRVRIPPSPPDIGPTRPAGRPPAGFVHSAERSPSGLWRRTGNAVRGNPSRVRIPPSPPENPRTHGVAELRLRPRGASGCFVLRVPSRMPPDAAPRYTCRCRARRGTSGALYLQSAPAGLNPLPRPPSSSADASSDVEGRVPRSGDSRTVSGPEGSSTKRSSSGAAEWPGLSCSLRWARERSGRRRVHGNRRPFRAPPGVT